MIGNSPERNETKTKTKTKIMENTGIQKNIQPSQVVVVIALAKVMCSQKIIIASTTIKLALLTFAWTF